MIQKLKKILSVNFKIEIHDTWLDTKCYAGAMLQVPIFGIMMEKLGRKRFLMITAVPIGVGWMLISFGTSLLQIYISRILIGFSAGMLVTKYFNIKTNL